MNRMTAKQLVRFAREKRIKLVGRTILTERVGEWPGGSAEIIAISPDPGALEIVFQVRHETARDPEGQDNEPWEIGVFEWEQVELCEQ